MVCSVPDGQDRCKLDWNRTEVPMKSCPICSGPLLREIRSDGDRAEVLCPNCSPFCVSGSLLEVLQRNEYPPIDRARVSYALFGRSMQMLTTPLVDELRGRIHLPPAWELLDNFLLHLAEEAGSPGEAVTVRARDWRARLGAQSTRGVAWVIGEAMRADFVQGQAASTLDIEEFELLDATLTGAGWHRVDELQRQAKDSRKAFMAMQFGDPELDRVFRNEFLPAVAETGFELRRLDDEPRAGLIDDRLRTEIRTSRFILAELSHTNPGAYWEAGYAEGLNRPVIYLCRKDIFHNPITRPHFDTNHHLTVVWDPMQMMEARKLLKSIIRVTLPSEAKLEDD